MNRVLLVILLLTNVIIVSAQSGSPKIFITPLAGTVVLRDIPDKYIAEVFSLEAPEPDGEQEQANFRLLKAKVSQQFPHRNVPANLSANAKVTAVNPPIIVQGFVPDSNAATPPDNSFGISKTGIALNMMNSRMAISVTTGTPYVATVKSLSTFTSSVGLNNVNEDYRYDPKLVYDPEADRFACVILNGTNQYNYIIFGFSQTPDPGGAWNFYKMYGDYGGDTLWFDYPIVSITHNELFLTGNKLVYNGSFQTGFRKSLIYEIRKSDGYAGLPLTTRIWDSVTYGGNPIRNIFPVNGGSGVTGPAQYFLSLRNMDIQNDSVFLMKIGDTIGSAGNTLSVSAYKSNLKYGFPPDGRQPDLPKLLQTNDGRVLGAYAEGNEIQFVSTSVRPATGGDAIYHAHISTYTSSPVVQADFITVDTMDFAYPNISYAGQVAGKNSSIISFDYSGPHIYPGLGAVMWDGSAHSPLLLVKEGNSYIDNSTLPAVRWGDYSGTQPVFGKTGYVWIAGIYGKAVGRYGTWGAQLRSPFVTAVPPLAGGTTQAVLYPNPAFQFIRLGFTLKTEALLHFALYNISGALIDGVLDAKCAAGENEIQFNTTPLAPGRYLMKGVSNDGQILVNKSFVKQ